MPEERLRAVFDAMSEGLVVHGPDGRVVDANAAAAPILGLSRDELLGRSPVDPRWRAVHEDGSPWPGQEHPVMQVLKSGLPLRGQVMGVDAPGRGRCWLRVNASPFGDGSGAGMHAGVVATFSDITAQRSLQARLAQSAAELTDLYDHAPCGYHTLDVHGRYLRINATELAWLGCSRDEVLGRLGPQDFYDDTGRATFAQCFPRLLAEGRIEGIELDLLGRDGGVRRVSVSATVIRDAAGQAVATRSVMHDITDLHRARTALQRLIVDQAAMLENDLVGIARVRERRLTRVNPGMTRLLGHGTDELVGRSTRELYFSEEDWLAVPAAWPADAGSGRPLRVQVRLRHRDGQAVWVDMSARRLTPGSTDLLVVLVDVSPRMQSLRLEAENREIRELLQERSDMLDVLAHEVRQPLNNASAALQSAGAALAEAGASQAALGLQHARAVMSQVLANIDNTLAVAALLASADTVCREDTDVDLLLGLAVGDMPSAQVARIDVQRLTATRTAALDLGLMRLALRNLLANALRYSAGAVVLRVADSDAPLALVLEVVDSGPGIAPELMPRLFERGTRGRHGPEQAGHGLGLFIVKRVMDLHGGLVQALRNRDAGMTMRLLVVQTEDRD